MTIQEFYGFLIMASICGLLISGYIYLFMIYPFIEEKPKRKK
jgi:hypothetical protein